MRRLAVLASGNGSNLQAIIDAIEAGELPGTRIAVVISNRKAAHALDRAKAHGISTLYHPLAPYRKAGRTRQQYDRDLAHMLAEHSIDLVVMAGWMHIFSLAFLEHYRGRVLNLHPALPGAYPGAHGIEEAYAAYQRGEIDHTGVMVHLVPDEGVDEGPVVAQEDIPIYPSDRLEDLEARIHAAEHALYVRAIAQLLELTAP